ncbi:hypothetical protein EMIHUDRAFT_213335 [Emiliania huxleyi CCMP1516]|uniref:Uncharacterized protein n=2 Tax=Emiliania huxleyi TaxID=2903 RepID=A0A0D3IMX9_EMIH1|nr:hypothetical protein EMIHUDRAFT_213335 [Emiliania huxleyi CCMP1516]EOD12614.1 hypothetical protein EMIHUDRAFT_213335 [Emiliania huxleyi CCMP1516]|eukprot:XP_005765043.1 hypothetical protein EMIHUDRAFT_213335 [Emiliania huxleyi CCMP1516]
MLPPPLPSSRATRPAAPPPGAGDDAAGGLEGLRLARRRCFGVSALAPIENETFSAAYLGL